MKNQRSDAREITLKIIDWAPMLIVLIDGINNSYVQVGLRNTFFIYLVALIIATAIVVTKLEYFPEVKVSPLVGYLARVLFTSVAMWILFERFLFV